MHDLGIWLVRHSFEDSSGFVRKIRVFTKNPRRNVEEASNKTPKKPFWYIDKRYTSLLKN